MNVFFEMVKTLAKAEQHAGDRGQHLFSYLKTWVNDDFLVAPQRLRHEMIEDFRSKPEAATRLKQIVPEQLEDWMEREVRSERGVSLLMGHLAQVLSKEMFSELRGIASQLLASDQYKISHALVRNGIYLNWRLAHRSSVPTSSSDDAYHVVNASYCHKVLTTDSDQAEQASYSLAGGRVGLYDYGTPLETWVTAGND